MLIRKVVEDDVVLGSISFSLEVGGCDWSFELKWMNCWKSTCVENLLHSGRGCR